MVIVVADHDRSPLCFLLDEYTVLTATDVVDDSERRRPTRTNRAVLHGPFWIDVREVDLDTTFPLDDGENAIVTLANEAAAAMFLCDEFNALGIVHASLIDTRLVTTPKLVAVFVRRGLITENDAATLLDEMSDVRSWANNDYVRRA